MERWASLEQLVKLLSAERACMRWVALRSLETRREEEPIKRVVKMLDDEDEDVRCAAIRVLGKHRTFISINAMTKKLYASGWKERLAVINSLDKLDENMDINEFLKILGDEKSSVREAALEIVKKIAPGALSMVASEAEAIIDGEPGETLLGSIQQYFIIDVISTMGKVSPMFLDKLIPLFDWPHWLVRLRTIQALGKIRRNIPD